MIGTFTPALSAQKSTRGSEMSLGSLWSKIFVTIGNVNLVSSTREVLAGTHPPTHTHIMAISFALYIMVETGVDNVLYVL